MEVHLLIENVYPCNKNNAESYGHNHDLSGKSNLFKVAINQPLIVIVVNSIFRRDTKRLTIKFLCPGPDTRW